MSQLEHRDVGEVDEYLWLDVWSCEGVVETHASQPEAWRWTWNKDLLVELFCGTLKAPWHMYAYPTHLHHGKDEYDDSDAQA